MAFRRVALMSEIVGTTRDQSYSGIYNTCVAGNIYFASAIQVYLRLLTRSRKQEGSTSVRAVVSSFLGFQLFCSRGNVRRIDYPS